MDTDSDQVVPDSQEERSMVTTSTEVRIGFFLRFFKYYSLFKWCEELREGFVRMDATISMESFLKISLFTNSHNH